MKKDHLQFVPSVRSLVKIAYVCAAALLPVQKAQAVWELSTDTVLTGPYSGQIQIVANGVTLDLNGHSITSDSLPWSIYGMGVASIEIISNNGKGFIRGSAQGICFEQCKNVRIKNVNVNARDHGINLTNCEFSTIENSVATGQQWDGIVINSGKDNEVRNCKAHNCGIVGIDIVAGMNQRLIGCETWENKLYGYRIQDATNFITDKCYTQDNGDYGFEFLYSFGGITMNCESNYNKIGFNNCNGATYWKTWSNNTASGNSTADSVECPRLITE
jgi:parallel beta-helix repeat protein